MLPSASVHCFDLFWLTASAQIVTSSDEGTAANATAEGLATLIVQRRPRILCRQLKIPLDATVVFVERSGRSLSQHTIEMQYGTKGKRLCLRFSSALERRRWMEVLAAATGMPMHAMVIQTPTPSLSNVPPKGRRASRSQLFHPEPVKVAQSTLPPVLQSGTAKSANWSLPEYYGIYIVAAAPHPTQQSLSWNNQQRPLPGYRYTNARGITFAPNCC